MAKVKQHALLNTVLRNGYIKQDYGFTKETGQIKHWITLFEGGAFQMYSYYLNDENLKPINTDKIYDTGVIKITPITLQVLISVLIESNHNF